VEYDILTSLLKFIRESLHFMSSRVTSHVSWALVDAIDRV
jgi:hypothetical protein